MKFPTTTPLLLSFLTLTSLSLANPLGAPPADLISRSPSPEPLSSRALKHWDMKTYNGGVCTGPATGFGGGDINSNKACHNFDDANTHVTFSVADGGGMGLYVDRYCGILGGWEAPVPSADCMALDDGKRRYKSYQSIV